MQHTYIRAIYTPDSPDEVEVGKEQPEVQSVTIVAFTEDGLNAIFVDEDGNLKCGYLRQFSSCVFETH